MKKITLLCALLFGFLGSVQAQISSLDVTGYNEDIVANGIGTMNSSTTMAADAGSFCLVSEDWLLNAGDTPLSVGLPANGQITSPDIAGLVYQIPTAVAPYEGNNSLRLDAAESTGTLTLVSPSPYSTLYFLVFSGNGSADIDVTINFDDATSETFVGNIVPDWFQSGLPVEIAGFGRGDRNNNTVETPNGDPKLFRLQVDISVPNQVKNVSSLTFTRNNPAGEDTVFNLLAVNGMAATSCLPPYDLVVSNNTTSSVDLSWSTDSSVSEWEIEYGAVGFLLGSGTIISDTDGTPGETISGLSASMQYEAYVTSICGVGDESMPIGPFLFDTSCGTVTTGFTEGFESTPDGALTDCWSIINQGGSDAWEVNDIGTNAYDGTKVMYISWDSNPGHDDYLITPQISVISGSTDRFRFHASSNSTFYQEVFNVLVSTTGTAVNDFTLVEGPINAAQSGWSEHEFNLSAYAGQNIYIAIQVISDNQLHLYIDGVILDALPACPKPVSLTAENITTNSADLGWTETGSATSWDIELGVAGFTPSGIPTNPAVTTNPFSATGLSSGTSYEFYVRGSCGGGEYSDWSGPYLFATNCDLVTTGFTEGFEFTDEGDVTNCWSIINQGGPDAWEVNDVGTDAYDGTKVMYISWDSNPGHDDYLITPQISVISGSTDRFRFQASSNSTFYQEVFNVLVSTTGTAVDDFTLVEGPINAAQSGWSEHEFNLSAYAGQNIYIAIQVISDNQLHLYIDGVILDALPACPKPISLTAENITTNSADLGWTETGSVTSWDIELGVAGFTPTGIPTNPAVTTNPFSATGLSSGTSYEFYVRGSCGGGEYSDWSGPYLFATNCDLVTTGFTEGFEFTDEGDVTNCWSIINQGGSNTWEVDDVGTNAYDGTKVMYISWDSNPGHDDYLITPQISVISGSTDRFRFQASSNSTFYQEVFNVLVSTTGTAVDDFTLVEGPINAAQSGWSEHEFNLSAYAGQNIYIAIQVISENQLHLYIDGVILDALPACPKPVSLTAENITTNSADLGWTETGSATSWDIELGVAGFTPTGIPTNPAVTTNPFSATGLSSGTSYEFYVRGACGGGEYSDWSGPYLFATNCDLVTTGFTEGFEFTDEGDVTNCWSIINQGGPDAWEVNDVGTDAYDGTKVMYISWDSNPGHDDYLITPQISVISGSTDRFWFQASSNSTFYQEVFNVLISTTGTDVDDFTLVDGPINAAQSGWSEHEFNLSAYAGQNIYIAIQVVSNNQLHLYIDGVVLDALPTCPKPKNLNAENITTNSADLSWLETSNATMWDIELGLEGFSPTGTPTNEDITNPYTAGGLLSGTKYDFYVRSDCGGGDTSVWVGPYTFQTNYTCGDIFYDDGGASGNYPNNATNTWVISADTPGYIVTVSFTNFNVQSSYDALYVYDGPDTSSPQIASFNPATFSGFPAGGFYGNNLPGPFTSTHPTGTLTFVFMSDGFTNQTGWTANISCSPPPACPAPYDLTAVPSTTSADLGWTENGSANAWDIELGFEGFQFTGTPTHAADSNPFTISNLDAGANYEFYVRANCGAGETSQWTGPFQFTTLCESVYVPDFLEEFTFFPNCWQEANAGTPDDGPLGLGSGPWFADEFRNTGDNISASIYIYKEDQIGWLISPNIDLSGGNYELAYVAAITDYFYSLPPEGNGMGSDDVINVMISEDNGNSWDILKTYNQDAFPSFDGDSEIIQLTGYTGTVQIAFWASGGTVDDPEAYDVFIDDFEVRTSTVTCAEPVNLTVSEITDENVTLSWDAVGNASGYTWYIFEAGADPETATPIATGTTSSDILTYVVQGLTPNTSYDFYVVADCGATDGVSEMAGPITFQTDELGVKNQFFEGFTYYPNPVKGQLFLESNIKIQEIILYNMLGQKVLKIAPDTLHPTLELDTLQAGTYLMKVNIEGVEEVFTIVKE